MVEKYIQWVDKALRPETAQHDFLLSLRPFFRAWRFPSPWELETDDHVLRASSRFVRRGQQRCIQSLTVAIEPASVCRTLVVEQVDRGNLPRPVFMNLDAHTGPYRAVCTVEKHVDPERVTRSGRG